MAIRRVAANLGSICLFLLFLCVASTLCMLSMSPNFASAVYFVGTSLIFGMGTLEENLKDQGTPPMIPLIAFLVSTYFPLILTLF